MSKSPGAITTAGATVPASAMSVGANEILPSKSPRMLTIASVQLVPMTFVLAIFITLALANASPVSMLPTSPSFSFSPVIALRVMLFSRTTRLLLVKLAV